MPSFCTGSAESSEIWSAKSGEPARGASCPSTRSVMSVPFVSAVVGITCAIRASTPAMPGSMKTSPPVTPARAIPSDAAARTAASMSAAESSRRSRTRGLLSVRQYEHARLQWYVA